MKLQDFRGAADDGDEALKYLKSLAALSGLNEETQALRRTDFLGWPELELSSFLFCVPFDFLRLSDIFREHGIPIFSKQCVDSEGFLR